MDAEMRTSFHPDAVRQALTLANLGETVLKRGSHPDNGSDCLYLEADIREYSAFLAALTVQYRHVDSILALADRVQIQHIETGDTRFWLPGISVRGF